MGGLFREVQRILKPDGVFIGDTLVELRVSLQLAELEREGGFSPHISPFVEVRYLSIFPLFTDLKGMGENSAAINRKLHLHRESLLAANAIYEELYGEPGQGEGQAAVVLPATFQVYYWIGWKPDKNQPKPLRPQKSDVSLKDLYKLDELAEAKGFTDLTDDSDPKKKI